MQTKQISNFFVVLYVVIVLSALVAMLSFRGRSLVLEFPALSQPAQRPVLVEPSGTAPAMEAIDVKLGQYITQPRASEMSAVDAKLGQYIVQPQASQMSAIDAKLGQYFVQPQAPQMSAVDAKLGQYIVQPQAPQMSPVDAKLGQYIRPAVPETTSEVGTFVYSVPRH